MSAKPNKVYHHVPGGLAPKSCYYWTQEFQLPVNVMVCIFNSGVLWTCKKLLGKYETPPGLE